MTWVEAELPLTPPPVAPITVEDILTEARSILARPEQWAKHTMLAFDNRNREVSALSEKATRWTVIGALRLAYERLTPGAPTSVGDWPALLWQTFDRVEALLPGARPNLLRWQNDPFTTHTEVLAVLKRAERT